MPATTTATTTKIARALAALLVLITLTLPNHTHAAMPITIVSVADATDWRKDLVSIVSLDTDGDGQADRTIAVDRSITNRAVPRLGAATIVAEPTYTLWVIQSGPGTLQQGQTTWAFRNQ